MLGRFWDSGLGLRDEAEDVGRKVDLVPGGLTGLFRAQLGFRRLQRVMISGLGFTA